MNKIRPAPGLRQLTWAQVELLDAQIKKLCEYAEQRQTEVYLPIIISREGKPFRIGEAMVMNKFKPGG